MVIQSPSECITVPRKIKPNNSRWHMTAFQAD